MSLFILHFFSLLRAAPTNWAAEDVWMFPQQTLIPVITVVSKPLGKRATGVLICRQRWLEARLEQQEKYPQPCRRTDLDHGTSGCGERQRGIRADAKNRSGANSDATRLACVTLVT